MTKCAFCRRIPSKVYHATGILLKSIQATQPQTREDTPICSICYTKALAQYSRFREKIIRRWSMQQATLSTVGSETSSSSLDSIDRMVKKRSLLSTRRERRNAEEIRKNSPLASPRKLQFLESRGRQETGSDMSPPDIPIERREIRTDSESIENPLDPVESLPSQTQGRMVVVREYESEEEVEVQREGDHLPGVQPYIRKRRTQVVFTDERLIPVYKNKSYGG